MSGGRESVLLTRSAELSVARTSLPACVCMFVSMCNYVQWSAALLCCSGVPAATVPSVAVPPQQPHPTVAPLSPGHLCRRSVFRRRRQMGSGAVSSYSVHRCGLMSRTPGSVLSRCSEGPGVRAEVTFSPLPLRPGR